MTLPPFVSEFPDSIVADCVPASGVMLADKITHNRYPGSIAEREALQNAMGTQDAGASAQQLADGMRKRYGLALLPSYTWAAIVAALSDPRKGVVLFGSYQKLPAAVRGPSRQPTFDGFHAAYAQQDGADYAALGDPLGSAFLRKIPIWQLEAFCAGLADMALIGTEQTATVVSYRASVGPGEVTFWRVLRFTHLLYGGLTNRFVRSSRATVRHGSPGFWLIADGYYAGRYLVAGKSGPFSISAVMSDGSIRPVPVAS